MIRRLTGVAAGVGVLLMASLANAQARGTFGQRGEFIVSADRLFPLLSYTHVSQDQFTPPPGNSKQVGVYNQASISLLWGSSDTGDANQPLQTSFFSIPRVGFDYVLFPNVTVGGDIIVFFTLGGNGSADTTSNAGVTTTNSAGTPSSLAFGIAPRGGYILVLSDLFSLWLRGGLSYYVASSKTTIGTATVTNSTNQGALDLDPQLVFTPIAHLGITLGLTADIPLAGGHSTETDQNAISRSNSASSSVLFFGATAGMLGHF
ncbi:MAG TPA: hypothetical protein VN894_09800 [Polyangiaceae bacterium]|nr:hypothetical protein [Polyangiaceae bacterium]